MFLKKLFPYALAACVALIFSSTALAQNFETRERQVTPYVNANGAMPVTDHPAIPSADPAETNIAAPGVSRPPLSFRFDHLISAAIDQKLGARYRWGGTGPSSFDCSGFVWSTFQAAGINFERGSARTLWARFEAPTSEDNFKFGTLVFFSGLTHVGIVADEHGFYHASRRHGVIYSPFNDYWLSRIDGFRRVPNAEPAAKITVD